jgi:hypothetical protein
MKRSSDAGNAEAPKRGAADIETTTTYAAVTQYGIVVRTFGDLELAKRWVRDNRMRGPYVTINEIVETRTQRCVYRPKRAVVVGG